MRFEIGGRETDGVAAAVAADDDALDAVRAAEHPAGEIDVARRRAIGGSSTN